MAKKQLTIRYDDQAHDRFVRCHPEFQGLSIGTLLTALMARHSQQNETIELQRLLVESLSQKAIERETKSTKEDSHGIDEGVKMVAGFVPEQEQSTPVAPKGLNLEDATDMEF